MLQYPFNFVLEKEKLVLSIIIEINAEPDNPRSAPALSFSTVMLPRNSRVSGNWRNQT